MKPQTDDTRAPATPDWACPCGATFKDLAKMLAHAAKCERK